MSKDPVAGALGIGAIVAAVIGVSVIITLVTGRYAHWPFVAVGIVVGFMAVAAINR